MELHKDPKIQKIQLRCKELALQAKKEKKTEDKKNLAATLDFLNSPLLNATINPNTNN